MDPVFCNATVDFNETGKSHPWPVKLTATVWTLSLLLPTETLTKYAIEFTDPSGKLASPRVPLNTWVQSDGVDTKDHQVAAPERCIEGSPLSFKDISDDDSKYVSLSGDRLFITPVSDMQRLSISLREKLLIPIPCFAQVFSTFVLIFCLGF